MTIPTTLYRFFDAEDGLLYVGITSVGPNRWGEHERHREWWGRVARTSVEHFPDRASATAAEIAAIRAESPAHNIAGRRVARGHLPVYRKHGQGTKARKGDGRWAVKIMINKRQRQWSVREESDADLIFAALAGRSASAYARREAIAILEAGPDWTPVRGVPR